MCKAGFAGDDAPRAVFRKCPAIEWQGLKPATPAATTSYNHVSITLTVLQPPLSADPVIMGTVTSPKPCDMQS